MKVKKFTIEVTNTTHVDVFLPETYDTDKLKSEWETYLWNLDDGIIDIAKYAALMVTVAPGAEHDGIGKMIENQFVEPDYNKNPHQVVAIIESEDVETYVIFEGDWEEK